MPPSNNLQPVASTSNHSKAEISPLTDPIAQVFQTRDPFPIRVTMGNLNVANAGQNSIARSFRRGDGIIPGTSSEEINAKNM
ncbi:hypothetical protein O181_005916 [Austropuccinia psidii MF-1]|uniref:Uncharacterized protein n=1 Tax=Austropuccinia psidii MF-1 TaxID=1389203 RepID=A0A9Q3BI73_9BASI|nr:hypothetical protein [Austropuccinia psidii MF-1]